MYGSEWMIATLLLLSPPGTPDLPIADTDWPKIQKAIQDVAIEWEILDPREVKYVLSRKEDFESDITLLRKRHQELKNAPKVAESQRLPERTLVNELLNFNRTFRKTLETKSTVEKDREMEYREVMRETDRLYQIWDSVRDARCEFYYITVRRQSLKKLKDMVGAEAYYTNQLPPFVPVWRFQEIR